MRQQIWPIRGDLDFDEGITAEVVTERRPDGRIGRQDQQSFMVLTETEFLS